MARIISVLSLLLLSGHGWTAADINRTESVVFSPQPAVRTRAVPLQSSPKPEDQEEEDEDQPVDFTKLATKFLPTSKKITNEECRLDSLAVVQALQSMEPWALKMIDAGAKIPAGILRGNIKSLGHFDECIAIKSTGKRNFIGQYCLANVDLRAFDDNMDRILDVATLGRRSIEITINRTNNVMVPDILPSMSLVQFASCLPSSCKPKDIASSMTDALQWILKSSGLKVSVQVFEDSCTTMNSAPWKPYTKGDAAMILVIIIFLLLVFLSSTYDIVGLNYVESESPVGKAILSFSLPRNWERLFSEDVVHPGVIGSLDGIRVFSTLWVIMTHKILYFAQEPWINKGELVESLDSMVKMPLVNTLLNVDTFLLISGMLKAYHYLRDLENKRFNFFSCYTRRYLRLTPAYMLVLAFYATLMVRMGSGPAWNKFVEKPTDACRENWFYNLIYLNNYINNDNQCMIQTWYLAMDFQLCLLAPLIVYPLWKWPTMGKVIFSSAALISVAIPLLTTYFARAIPTYLLGHSDADIKWYMNNIYYVTHQRASPYVIGLALGYLFYRLNTTKVKLTKVTVAAGWALCLTTLYAVIFGSYDLVQYNHPYDRTEATLYGGLHRAAWALSVGWIIFACNTGYGGYITRLLSARFFQPLSKLSYSIFLTHYIILMIDTGRIRTPIFVDEYSLLHRFVGDFALSFALALVLYLVVESPLFEIVKIIYNKKKPSKASTKHELDTVHVAKLDHQSQILTSIQERP